MKPWLFGFGGWGQGRWSSAHRCRARRRERVCKEAGEHCGTYGCAVPRGLFEWLCKERRGLLSGSAVRVWRAVWGEVRSG